MRVGFADGGATKLSRTVALAICDDSRSFCRLTFRIQTIPVESERRRANFFLRLHQFVSMASKTSNAIQTCPGCDSFILSDTFECPECGHVFDTGKAAAANAAKAAREAEQRKFSALHDPCPTCGEMVRTGLVRCWKCNSFMREDVAQRYRSLTSNPQPIIFSDIPAEKRTEFIPARLENRHGAGYGRDVFDAEDDQDSFSVDDEFTLQDSEAAQAGGEFELDADVSAGPARESSVSPAPAAAPVARTDGPDQPRKQTPGDGQAADAGSGKADKDATSKDGSGGAGDGKTDVDSPKKPELGADELLGIAMREQRETQQRRRERLAEAKRKRILIPCTCGAWVRVTVDQSGRTVRCRQCKNPMLIPEIKKKDKPVAQRKKEAAPEISVEWIDDVHLHVLNPTDLVLKPGSLEKAFEPVDLGFHESGLQIINLGSGSKAKKKSMFGRAGGGSSAADEPRTQVREHISKSGGFTGLPHGELLTVDADKAKLIRLVQPVAAAHQSMFAGVSVFGEGRIAVYLPADPGEGRQTYLSFPLSVFRQFAQQLQTTFSVELPATENGVPPKEESETLSCFVNQSRVEALKNLTWYQNDPGFELELTGYKCSACGIAISEESRAKQKLGGAAGKSIAKAKCPKCSSKLGNVPLYRLAKGTSRPENSDTSSAAAEAFPASAAPPPDATGEPVAADAVSTTAPADASVTDAPTS